MVTTHQRASLRIITCLSLVGALTVGGGAAHAQQVNAAPDGQQFRNQSAATQADFLGTFGTSCAQQEWVWQHTLAVNPDTFDGPPAIDGQRFGAQDDDDVQLPFVALFGPQASTAWVTEHNALVAHKVLLSSMPVPCPPAKTTVVDAIGTTHLADAVEAADAKDLADSIELFKGFNVLWAAAKPKVQAQSAPLAQTVQTAVDQVNALIGDPNAPAASQSQYAAALADLLKTVKSANFAIAHGNAQAGVAGSPGAAALPAIRAGNLGQAVDAATSGDLANTRKEFGEFQDDWGRVSDAWHAGNASVASGIDAAITQLKGVIGDTSQSPAQAQYQPIIQNLQKLVQDANANATAAPVCCSRARCGCAGRAYSADAWTGNPGWQPRSGG